MAAKRGVIDLSSFDVEEDGVLALDGQWHFAWEVFTNRPDTFETYIEIPGNWKSYSGKSDYDADIGYGTYGLSIILPDTGRLWSLKLPPIHSAYRLFINGELKSTVGEIGRDRSMNPGIRAQVIDLHSYRSSIDIVIQVSNFHFFSAGIWNSLELGPTHNVRQEVSNGYFLAALLIGALVVMGFYHFGLFFLWPKDRGTLFFALICFLVALRQCFSEQAFFYKFFPSFDYEWSLAVLYAIFPLSLTAFIFFLSSIYSNFSKVMQWIGVAASLAFLVLILFTKNTFYAKFLPVIFLVFIIQSGYWLILIVKDSMKRPKHNLLLFSGVLALVLAIINDQLFERGAIDSYFLLPFGFVLFILFQSLLLALRFSETSRKSETLSFELDKSQELVELEKRKLKELEELEDMKNRFFSNITHEFRTPLTLIIAPVESLLKGAFSKQMIDKSLRTILANARQLLSLINQLLDLVKLESHHVPVVYYRGNPQSFIKEIGEPFHLLAEKSDIRFGFTSTFDASKEIFFDAEKLKKVVDNLLSNAFKFTSSKGSVDIALSDLNDCIIIEVSDSGVGIDGDELPFVFNRFYQAKQSSSRAFAGTGIGLSLVKEVMDLVGGDIEVESTKDVGTTFKVRFPYKLEHDEAPSMIETQSLVHSAVDPPLATGVPTDDTLSKASMTSTTILIVEDNSELLEYMTASFGSLYNIIGASNGLEGWEKCRDELPDLVISDVMMPVMDGIQLVKKMKQETLTNHIGIIMLTAKGSHEDKVKALKHGVLDYLAKPFSFEELNLKIANFLRHRDALRSRYIDQLKGRPTAEKTQVNPFLSKVYQVLEANLSNSELGVESVAEALSVSARTLNRKLKSLLDLSANEVIKNYRLKKAKEFLIEGSNVSETAYRVGFESPSYFGQCFKEVYRMSPRDFALQQGIVQ